MVNLEWYRTFKSVYKNGNFSQPAVSQQIAMLEAHVGYSLFNRKSKGVEPTEYAKLLNNLIIEALDRLENVENGFREKAFQSNKLISVGLSKHYFPTFGKHLIKKFDFIDFTFAENEALFKLVDDKKIDLAIVSKKYETFDTIQVPIGNIKLILVSSLGIDLKEFKTDLDQVNLLNIEKWLSKQKWYSQEAQIPNVKMFWLHAFDKKRPTIIANYIIPNENEMLDSMIENKGIAAVWNINAKPFLQKKQLQLVWNSEKIPTQEIYLLVRKNNSFNSILDDIKEELVPLFE